MVLQSSNAISVGDVCNEFNISKNLVKMSKLYKGNYFISKNNANIPSSGILRLANFYSSQKSSSLTTNGSISSLALTGNTCNINLASYFSDANIPTNSTLTYSLSSNLYNVSTISSNYLTITDSVSRSYNLTVIATNLYGQTTTMTIPIINTVSSFALNSIACPPLPLSGTTTTLSTGTYITSASTNTNDSAYAFDMKTMPAPSWQSAATYTATSGEYSGSVSTVADNGTNTYQGEWLQIQLPGSVMFSEYVLLNQTTTYSANIVKWYILGSTDGNNWTTLSSVDMSSTPWSSDTNKPYSFSMSNNSCSYVRMVINKTAGNTSAYVSHLSYHTTSGYPSTIYPRAPITAFSSNFYEGTFNIAQSSENSTMLYPGWKVFDFNSTQPWMPLGGYLSTNGGIYGGSTSTSADGSNTYMGEWVQLQVPSPIQCRTYSLTNQSFTSANRNLVKWYLVGSCNGTNWFTLDSRTVPNTYWAYTSVAACNFTVTNPQTCQYMRLVVNQVGGGGNFYLSDMSFYV